MDDDPITFCKRCHQDALGYGEICQKCNAATSKQYAKAACLIVVLCITVSWIDRTFSARTRTADTTTKAETYQALCLKSTEAYNDNDFLSAVLLAEKAIDIWPNHALAKARRGLAYVKVAYSTSPPSAIYLQVALVDFEDAKRLDPQQKVMNHNGMVEILKLKLIEMGAR